MTESKYEKYAGIWGYDIRLIKAIEYLIEHGITNTVEIARRLNVSPWTVRNIRYILRKKKEEMKKKEKPIDIIKELLSGGY